MECISKRPGKKERGESSDMKPGFGFSPMNREDRDQPRPRVYPPHFPEGPREQKPDESEKPKRGSLIISPDGTEKEGVTSGN